MEKISPGHARVEYWQSFEIEVELVPNHQDWERDDPLDPLIAKQHILDELVARDEMVPYAACDLAGFAHSL